MSRHDPRRAILDQIRLELEASVIALIDGSTGMLLSCSHGDSEPGCADANVIAVGCTDVVRSQEMLAAAMASSARVEDIMVVTGDDFQIYHPVPGIPGWFVWATISREKHSLALSRILLERLSQMLLATPTTSLLAG